MNAYRAQLQARSDGDRSNAHTIPLPPGDSAAISQSPLLKPVGIQSLEKRRLQCYIGIMLADIAAVVWGFAIGGYVLPRDESVAHALLQAQMLIPLFLTVALYNSSYSIRALRDKFSGIILPLQALAVAALGVALLAYLAKTGGDYSRLVFVSGLLVSAIFLVPARLAMYGFVRWSCGNRVENILVVQDGGPPLAIDDAYRVEARAAGFTPVLNDPVALDHLSRWFEPMDRVIVSCADDKRFAWAQALKGLAVEGEVVDQTVSRLGALGARRYGANGSLLVSHRPLGLRMRALKRLFDLALTIPALILLAPLMIVVALIIRLQDGGPALFIQRRTGRGSRFFSVFKFRSMRVDQADATGEQSASRTDLRITPIGRFIRKTSIDELPQLFNVIKGDMSLVGPRPHAMGSQAGDKLFWEIDERYWQRHTLKPGLTGLAQIRGHRGATESESDLVARLQSDLEYLDGWTIWRDIGILLLTLRVVIHERAF